MVEGISDIKSSKEICKGCIVSKHHEHKLDRGKSRRAYCILRLIHSDIIGMIPNTSMNGLRYVLAVIDYLSIFTWVYFLKKKSQVFEKFKDLKAFVEIATRRKIKSLRSDNGGEYTKSELLYICVENGINIQHIVPYTPQQNSVVERKKRALK